MGYKLKRKLIEANNEEEEQIMIAFEEFIPRGYYKATLLKLMQEYIEKKVSE